MPLSTAFAAAALLLGPVQTVVVQPQAHLAGTILLQPVDVDVHGLPQECGQSLPPSIVVGREPGVLHVHVGQPAKDLRRTLVESFVDEAVPTSHKFLRFRTGRVLLREGCQAPIYGVALGLNVLNSDNYFCR